MESNESQLNLNSEHKKQKNEQDEDVHNNDEEEANNTNDKWQASKKSFIRKSRDDFGLTPSKLSKTNNSSSNVSNNNTVNFSKNNLKIDSSQTNKNLDENFETIQLESEKRKSSIDYSEEEKEREKEKEKHERKTTPTTEITPQKQTEMNESNLKQSSSKSPNSNTNNNNYYNNLALHENTNIMFQFQHSLSSVLADPKSTSTTPIIVSHIDPNTLVSTIQPIPQERLKNYYNQVSQMYTQYTKNKKKIETFQNSASVRQGNQKLTLDSIPSMYFRENFDSHSIEEGLILNIMQQGTESSLLIEQLASYVDIVEMELAKEISVRSKAFVGALKDIHGFHKDIKLILKSISLIRENMKHLQTEFVRKGLIVVFLKNRVTRYIEILEKMESLMIVRNSFETLQRVFASDDFLAAFELMEELSLLVHSKLEGIRAVRGIVNEIEKMRQKLEEQSITATLNFSQDLEKSPETADADLVSKVASFFPKQSVATSSLLTPLPDILEQLLSRVMFLIKFNSISRTISLYRQLLSQSFKSFTRQLVRGLLKDENVASNSSQTLEQSSKLNWKLVGDMKREKYVLMISLFFSSTLRKLHAVECFFLLIEWIMRHLYEPISNSNNNNNTNSNHVKYEMRHERFVLALNSLEQSFPLKASQLGLEIRTNDEKSENFRRDLVTEMKSIIKTLTEYAHSKAAKMLRFRMEANCQMTPVHFITMYSEIQWFMRQSEEIVSMNWFPNFQQNQSSLIHSLRPVVTNLARGFIENYYNTKQSSLALTLDNETWSQTPVIPQEFQNIVERIMKQQTDNTQQTPQASNNTLRVKDRTFVVVMNVLLLLKIVEEFLKLMDDFPNLALDISKRLIDILKYFNSRTRQLILGAEAIKLSKLKSITSKHLALAAQSLNVVIELLPSVRDRVLSKLQNNSSSPTQQNPTTTQTQLIQQQSQQLLLSQRHLLVIPDWDRIMSDYVSHRNQINEKFVEIMRERAEVLVLSLKSIDWNEISTKQPEGLVTACATLLKETETILKILSQFFSKMELQIIFGMILTQYLSKLEGFVLSIKPHSMSENARKRLLSELTLFSEKLSQSLQFVSVDMSSLFSNFHRIE